MYSALSLAFLSLLLQRQTGRCGDIMTSLKTSLSADRLRELLNYNPKTGVFTWRTGANSDGRKNPYTSRRRAGSLRPSGYRAVRVDYELYQEHRLAWLYVHGVWPSQHIDHKNRDTSDNRISNLREASRGQNLANMATHKDNSSGFKGVAFHKRLGWFARICVNRKHHFLGYHPTPEAAHAAYVAASERLRGQFSRSK